MDNRQLGTKKIIIKIFKDTGFNTDIIANLVEVNSKMPTLQETK